MLLIPILFVFVLFLLVGLGLGVGWLLHWMIPTLDFDIACLIGVLAVVASTSFVSRLIWQLSESQQEDDELAEFLHKATRPLHIALASPISARSGRTSRKKRPQS